MTILVSEIQETLFRPSKALFMDEISTGLESSTAFQMVNSIKQYVYIFNGTAVISLLQPAPETYNLFDDIILISDGQIAYQGPREQVLEFFESMGFKCPERKGVADFLQDVSLNKGFFFFFLVSYMLIVLLSSKEISITSRISYLDSCISNL